MFALECLTIAVDPPSARNVDKKNWNDVQLVINWSTILPMKMKFVKSVAKSCRMTKRIQPQKTLKGIILSTLGRMEAGAHVVASAIALPTAVPTAVEPSQTKTRKVRKILTARKTNPNANGSAIAKRKVKMNRRALVKKWKTSEVLSITGAETGFMQPASPRSTITKTTNGPKEENVDVMNPVAVLS